MAGHFMLRHMSLARFVPFPENQSALTAIQDLAANVLSAKRQRSPSPLFLHGPPGCGKSHLVAGLATECAASGGISIQCLLASEFREQTPRSAGNKTLAIAEAAPTALTLA